MGGPKCYLSLVNKFQMTYTKSCSAGMWIVPSLSHYERGNEISKKMVIVTDTAFIV